MAVLAIVTALALTILVVVSAVLFVLGFVAPRRSRKAERKVDEALVAGERQSWKAPGRVPRNALRESLAESRKLADKSAESGRGARQRLTSQRDGSDTDG